MKFLFFLLSLAPIAAFAQKFEGEIVYSNAYKSKMPNMTDEQFTAAMGSKQHYFIKGNNYKSTFNGSYIKSQTYIGSQNKSYSVTIMSDTAYWEDYSINKDAATRFEIKKDRATIMGLLCDEITVYTPSGRTIYYYNKKYAVDPTIFKNHANGNWYYIISQTKALPLRIVYENQQFTMTSTAVSASPDVLENKIFELADKDKVAPARW